ncbi:MAG: hypothetical protein JWM53_2422 [bacterium]|nr:hypothetical protein [bacterium]
MLPAQNLAKMRTMRSLHLHQGRRGQKGFTLPELMAVVAIVGVMGAIAMATMSRSGDAQNAAALARSLQFAMMNARNATLSDGIQRRLACSLSTAQLAKFCTVDKATTPGPPVAPAPGMVLPNNVTWTSESRINAGNHATLWNVTLTKDETANNAGSSQVTATRSLYFRPDGTVCDTYSTVAAPTTSCTSSNGLTFYVADSGGSNKSNQFKIYVYPFTGMPRMVNIW